MGTLRKPQKDEYWMSVDPGVTSGWAVWKGEVLSEFGEVYCGSLPETQAGGIRELVQIVREHSGSNGGVFLVVMEDFLLRGNIGTTDRSGLSPVHVAHHFVGYLHAIHGGMPAVVWQLASGAKSVITDGRMKGKGLYMRGKPHANDAIRHGLLYLRRCQ